MTERLERRLRLPVLRYPLDRGVVVSPASFDVLFVGCAAVPCLEREPQLPAALADLDLRGKRVALFAVGDQRRSPGAFRETLEAFGQQIEARGGRLLGRWSATGYAPERACSGRDDLFSGLALDYENQADFNLVRIVLWTEQLIRELALQPEAALRCGVADPISQAHGI
jgi:hypothetical protein